MNEPGEPIGANTTTGQWMEFSGADGITHSATKMVINADWLLSKTFRDKFTPPLQTYNDVVVIYHGSRHAFTTEEVLSRLGIEAGSFTIG